jgi:hypothetical protein
MGEILAWWIECILTQPMDFLTHLLYLIQAVIVLVHQLQHLFYLLGEIFQPLSKIKIRLPRFQHKSQQQYSHSYLTDPKNRILQKKLLNMLNGDVATAKRLLRHQRQLYKDKSDNWYLEKVIYDLERDRRR